MSLTRLRWCGQELAIETTLVPPPTGLSRSSLDAWTSGESIWEYVAANQRQFTNPQYKEAGAGAGVLKPLGEAVFMKVWMGFHGAGAQAGHQ